MAIFSKLKLPSGEIRDIAAKFDADGNEIKTTYAKKSDVPTGGDADTVNGHTVESDVPANAKFTDTTYTPASDAPLMDGTGAVGSSEKYAREDHVHPSDSSRVPTSRTINGHALSSNISLTASDVNAIPSSQKGAASGIAELDSTGKVPSSQLPSYVDDVLEYASSQEFPLTGETGKIYIDTSSDITYRWSGSAYVAIGSSLALGETSSTAYRGDRGAAAYKHAVTNKGSAFTTGLYKITTNSEGHVISATAVEKADITALGIPGQDTTYSLVGTQNTTGLVKNGSDVTDVSTYDPCPFVGGVPYYKNSTVLYDYDDESESLILESGANNSVLTYSNSLFDDSTETLI